MVYALAVRDGMEMLSLCPVREYDFESYFLVIATWMYGKAATPVVVYLGAASPRQVCLFVEVSSPRDAGGRVRGPVDRVTMKT